MYLKWQTRAVMILYIANLFKSSFPHSSPSHGSDSDAGLPFGLWRNSDVGKEVETS